MADDDRAERPTDPLVPSGDGGVTGPECRSNGTAWASERTHRNPIDGAGDAPGTPGADRPSGVPEEDLREPKFSWQGAPGYSPFDPQRFPPHAPMPGAPPYPAGAGHGPPPVSAGRRDPALPRCLVAAAVWAVLAVVLAVVTGAGEGWGLRTVAIGVPFLLTVGALTVPARRARAGIGVLVLVAFPVFWITYAVALTG